MPPPSQALLFGSPVPPAERSKDPTFQAIRDAIDAEPPEISAYSQKAGGNRNQYLEDTDQNPSQKSAASPPILETRGTTETKWINQVDFNHLPNPEKWQEITKPKQLDFWLRLTVQRDQVVQKLEDIHREDLAEPLKNCHDNRTIALCARCKTPTAFYNRCEVFWCPICQPRLARDKRKRIEPLALTMRRPLHVVLTITNIKHLTKAKVTWFKDCFKKLRQSKLCTETTQLGHFRDDDPYRGKTLTSHPWKGGIYSIEVTNEGRGAHLHMHVLVDCHFCDQLALSEKWREITEGNGHIVSVKDCRHEDYLHEIGKYIVKGSDLATWDGQTLANFIDAMKDTRTWGMFGTLFARSREFANASKLCDDQTHVCKCGCERFIYMTETQWEWFELTGFLPPPRPHRN